MSLQPVRNSAVELFKSLPVPVRVVVAIVGALTAIYFWYFLLGLFFIVAMCVGVYHMVRWFVTRP